MKIYGLILATSILIYYILVVIELIKNKLKFETIALVTLPSFILMIVGGKFFTVVTTGKSFAEAGLASLGASAGVIIWIVTYIIIDAKNKKTILRSFIKYIPLLYGLSKIACIFGHCCYGIEYNGPLAISLQNKEGTYFPIQIVESISFIILFFILLFFNNKKHINEYSIMACAFLKGLLDFLRYTHDTSYISINQITCTFIIIIMIISIKIFNEEK